MKIISQKLLIFITILITIIALAACVGNNTSTGVRTTTIVGLYFEIFEIFEVENIIEVTQNHLPEEMRNDPSVIQSAREYMNQPVLFVPVTITNPEIQPDALDYVLRPAIRTFSPSGARSIFEADSLNGKNILHLASFDEIPNEEGFVLQGYVPFVWQGYGEYRMLIVSLDGRTLAEFIFDVTSDVTTYVGA
ncbi:MAG: hypothetical protein FWC98_05390 [Bacteroidales bacterium]|nr:hypothetical protein [Bacteroidales bacterium]